MRRGRLAGMTTFECPWLVLQDKVRCVESASLRQVPSRADGEAAAWLALTLLASSRLGLRLDDSEGNKDTASVEVRL